MRKGMFIAMYVIMLGSICAQIDDTKNLFPIYSADKCGYMDQEGNLVVPVKFDICRQFDEGAAGVSLSRKVGYIDGTGQVIIPLQFEGFPESFSEGLAPIKLQTTNGTLAFGYVDKAGKISLIEGATEIGNFHEGLAIVEKGGKVGFIDKRMKFAIQPQFHVARSFTDGLAWVSDRSGEEYFIDKLGKRVITNCGTNLGDFSEGLATFKSKYVGYGYIDTNGKVMIKPQFNSACVFKEGLACAENDDGKWGFIDKGGEFLIRPQFEAAENFSPDGIASVSINGKWGFIDKSGKFLLEPRFDRSTWINGLGLVEFLGKERYVNRNNVFVW